MSQLIGRVSGFIFIPPLSSGLFSLLFFVTSPPHARTPKKTRDALPLDPLPSPPPSSRSPPVAATVLSIPLSKRRRCSLPISSIKCRRRRLSMPSRSLRRHRLSIPSRSQIPHRHRRRLLRWRRGERETRGTMVSTTAEEGEDPALEEEQHGCVFFLSAVAASLR